MNLATNRERRRPCDRDEPAKCLFGEKYASVASTLSQTHAPTTHHHQPTHAPIEPTVKTILRLEPMVKRYLEPTVKKYLEPTRSSSLCGARHSPSVEWEGGWSGRVLGLRVVGWVGGVGGVGGV